MSQDFFSWLIFGLRLYVIKFYVRDCPQDTSGTFGPLPTSSAIISTARCSRWTNLLSRIHPVQSSPSTYSFECSKQSEESELSDQSGQSDIVRV